jgi:hypothetical protein
MIAIKCNEISKANDFWDVVCVVIKRELVISHHCEFVMHARGKEEVRCRFGSEMAQNTICVPYTRHSSISSSMELPSFSHWYASDILVVFAVSYFNLCLK